MTKLQKAIYELKQAGLSHSQIATKLGCWKETVTRAIKSVESEKNKSGWKIGVFSDPHLPFDHPRYLDFIKDTFEEHGVNEVVCTGDFLDHHFSSFHDVDPDGLSAGDELRLARERIAEYVSVFPKLTWVYGNHDLIPKRKLLKAGLSQEYLKSFHEVYNLPETWDLVEDYYAGPDHLSKREKLKFVHELPGGVYGYRLAVLDNLQSTIGGHIHTSAGFHIVTTPTAILFGLNTGCGMDVGSYAAAYGKKFRRKPTMSCAVIVDYKYPILIPMDMDKYKR